MEGIIISLFQGNLFSFEVKYCYTPLYFAMNQRVGKSIKTAFKTPLINTSLLSLDPSITLTFKTSLLINHEGIHSTQRCCLVRLGYCLLGTTGGWRYTGKRGRRLSIHLLDRLRHRIAIRNSSPRWLQRMRVIAMLGWVGFSHHSTHQKINW